MLILRSFEKLCTWCSWPALCAWTPVCSSALPDTEQKSPCPPHYVRRINLHEMCFINEMSAFTCLLHAMWHVRPPPTFANCACHLLWLSLHFTISILPLSFLPPPSFAMLSLAPSPSFLQVSILQLWCRLCPSPLLVGFCSCKFAVLIRPDIRWPIS